MISYLHAHFQTAVTLIESYDGKLPLHYFLKNYFAQNKKHGSKDRKNITLLCYNYYRLGHALKNLPVAERLKIAFFLCNKYQPAFAHFFEQNMISSWSDDLNERIVFVQQLYPSFSLSSVFPFYHNLGKYIATAAFSQSFLVQPNLFLRIRPGYEHSVKQKLCDAKLEFQSLPESAIALPNNTKLEDKLQLNKEAVIQDYSSQRTAGLLRLVPVGEPLKVWDCCTGSGGKSILAYDVLKNIHLTVSDLRTSILHNLQKRFSEAGIKDYTAFQCDLSKPVNVRERFDFIICDAPCTGSGTWSRTPEALYFFDEKEI
ncbi:MAG: Fmu (Sun) domain-containing protein, partial [Chitinophagaceae bacterium]|nr:Fmu (Sun) domain-containing protein [Chitinophagaceae bacterium]